MTISIKFMRYFTAAIEAGSISKAAENLNIAASAISASIDQVEASFQMKLVTRHRSRGIQPTAAGRTLMRKFSVLIDDYDALIAEGIEMRDAVTGPLKIGYYAPVSPAFLPTILKPLICKNPNLHVELEACDNDRAQTGLLDGSFDVIFFVAEDARPTVDYDALVKVPAYCLMAQDHPLASQKSVCLADLREEATIALNRPVAYAYYRQLFETIEAKPNTVAVVNSTEMVRSLVGAGLGCAILNMRPTTDQSYGGDHLVCLPLSDELSPLTLAIGYTKPNPRRAVRSFVDACQSYFASDAGRAHIVEL